MRLTMLLAWLILGVTACHRSGPEVDAEPNTGEVAVRVVNHNFADVVIYLDERGNRFRLGMASGQNTTLFFVPWRRVATGGRIRLFGDPIGGEAVVATDELAVRQGSMVVWTLESPLSRSFSAVY